MSPSRPTRDCSPARLEKRATWLISRAHARAAGLLNAGFDAGGAGLRGYHYRLLSALEEGVAASQAELGRTTGIDRSDVTTALTELDSRGLVERSADPAHRRRNIVTITAQGLARLVELDAVIDGIQEEFLAPLSVTQRRQLLSLMRRLLAEQ